jgi:hypothetical protein
MSESNGQKQEPKIIKSPWREIADSGENLPTIPSDGTHDEGSLSAQDAAFLKKRDGVAVVNQQSTRNGSDGITATYPTTARSKK